MTLTLTRHPSAVEAHRAAVDLYRPILAPSTRTDEWLWVIYGESRGDRKAVNAVSGASGLFQHKPEYWSYRFRVVVTHLASIGEKFPWMRRAKDEQKIADAIWMIEPQIAVSMRLQATSGWHHWEAAKKFLPQLWSEHIWWSESDDPAEVGYRLVSRAHRGEAP